MTLNREAEKFMVQRKNQLGQFINLAEVTEKSYIDKANLMVGIEYSYRVVAVNGAKESFLEDKIIETRGIAGDIDRSDRVDGKDLAKLAKAYGKQIGDAAFETILDLNFDGQINGQDLVVIGNNFGLIF